MPTSVQSLPIKTQQLEAVKTETPTVSTKKTTVVWNEKTICSDGAKFLKDRFQHLQINYNLFRRSTPEAWPIFSNTTAIQSEKKMVALAKENLPELNQFYIEARKLMDLAIKKDPISAESRKLINLVQATADAITYFESVASNNESGINTIIPYSAFSFLCKLITEQPIDKSLIINNVDLIKLVTSLSSIALSVSFIALTFLSLKNVFYRDNIEKSEKRFIEASKYI